MSLFERIARARPAWMARGTCRTPAVQALVDAGRVNFFPVPGGAGRDAADAARRICADCPVRIDCYQYALEHRELTGIWGGFGEGARRQERARRRREVVA